jgi:phage terminase small subunit
MQTVLQTFAQELIASNFNIKKASETCGLEYSVAKGYWKREDVQSMVNEMVERRTEARKVTSDWVLGELCNVAGVKIGDFIDETGEVNIMSIMGRAGAAVSELTSSVVEQDGRISTRRRLKLHDKLRALELLGRHLALFTDKVQVEGLDSLAEEMKAARVRVEQHGK